MNTEQQVLIKTLFGDITDQDRFFSESIVKLWQQTTWWALVQPRDSIYAGPFCYTLLEQEIPF